MYIPFSEIKDSVLRALGVDTDTVETTTDTDIELRINEAQDVIFYDRDWEWRKRDYSFTTKAPYETGTISITQGSAVVTGDGTTWAEIHKLGLLMVDGIAYRILSIDSTTQLTLESPFPKDTISDESYKIVFPFVYLHPDIAAVITAWLETSELDVKEKERVLNSQVSVGTPQELCIGDLSKKDFYTTGTIAVTNGNATITGTNTQWTSAMVGLPFRVDEFGELYIIESFTNAGSITLNKKYRGSTGSGKSYTIAPKGSPLIRLASAPDDYYYIELEALIKPERLVDTTDYSLIPNHTPLVHAARWLAVQDVKDTNPVRIQQARSDFERTLKQLRDMYKVITNIRWRNPVERQIRRNGGIVKFNPLEP